ncbi:MAG: 2-hydroxyacyl-CoA dehydratase family protein [Deltaproteobacteria bacterium]|nr:2-hydroxyacyl-CoA dehydratase family protein [Deltaproteobacteria bacterium]
MSAKYPRAETSGLKKAQYLLGAKVAGGALLKLDRMKLARKLARPPKPGPFGPPLKSSAWLKELITGHYLKGRFASGARPVAWVTSGAPVEPLIALGFFPIYPENHGAVCGIRRSAEEICEEAESAGYSRDICSYARTDIGSMLSGKTPVGRLPPPDLLVCCTNICQTVLLWYRVLAQHFGCPLVNIDTPFLYGEAQEHQIAFVEKQLEELVRAAEEVSGNRLTEKKLHQVTRYSKQATELWAQIIQMGRHRPAPITAFDQFIHLAPIVEMRGEPFTVDYYGALLEELQERAAQGVGALKEEKIRLVWDNLPVWHKVRWLSEVLAESNATLVASTYTNAWGELTEFIDPENPMRSAALTYLHPILNRGTGHKLSLMKGMVESFEADGVILHSDRSCKPYSIGQVDQRERLTKEAGVPALLLEADHNDPRAFSEEQSRARVEAFLEVVEAKA